MPGIVASPLARLACDTGALHAGMITSMSKEQIAKGRAQVIAFSEKLFSLANSNERIRQLWYEHGRQVRHANPSADKKCMLSMIVKAFWKDAKEDSELFQQIWSHTAKFTSQSSQQNLTVRPSCALAVQPSCVLTQLGASGSGDLGLFRAPSTSSPLMDRGDSALPGSATLPLPEPTQEQLLSQKRRPDVTVEQLRSKKRGREGNSDASPGSLPEETDRSNSRPKFEIASLYPVKDAQDLVPRDTGSARQATGSAGSAKQATGSATAVKQCRAARSPMQNSLKARSSRTQNKTLPDGA